MIARRRLLQLGLLGAAAALPCPAISQGLGARVVVIGGGFGGTSCVRALKRLMPKASVTLIERDRLYTAYPLANSVLAGLRDITAQQFGYDGLRRAAIDVVIGDVVAIDSITRRVTLADNTQREYDRLVLSPGIALRFDALPGYDAAAAETMPHAWTSGAQLALLASQLAAMPDGGTVLISAPVTPMRCPPAPYERASLIAYYLKQHKPRSKVIVLDAKDSFSQQRQFQAAWRALYPDMLQWVSLSDGGNVTDVDVGARTLITDFEKYRGDVVNVIPPQRAGDVAMRAGVTDRTGWCPVDAVAFESSLQGGIHVIGDAALVGTMPKSASAASGQGKACAAAIAKLLDRGSATPAEVGSTCYSLVAPDYGISIAGRYSPEHGEFAERELVATAPDAPRDEAMAEAKRAQTWFEAITGELFG